MSQGGFERPFLALSTGWGGRKDQEHRKEDEDTSSPSLWLLPHVP